MGLLDFLSRLKRKKSKRKRPYDPFQRRLDFGDVPKSKSFPPKTNSFKQMKNRVKEDLEFFRMYMKEVRNASLKMEELERMVRSGEVAKSTYDMIAAELGEIMTSSLESLFKLKEDLEMMRVRAKLEWVREKAEIGEARMIDKKAVGEQHVYSSVSRWEGLISDIDKALSSLTIDEEISFLERYLSLTQGGNPSKERSEAIERGRELCGKRLEAIRKTWSSIRREKIEQLMRLEHESSQLKEKIREAEVRFEIGYYDENAFEAIISGLKADLQKAERQISDIRDYVDEMDRKVFRCLEILEGTP